MVDRINNALNAFRLIDGTRSALNVFVSKVDGITSAFNAFRLIGGLQSALNVFLCCLMLRVIV